MFRESADKEQELYQAIARAGTLLLQIGDAAIKEDAPISPSETSFARTFVVDDCKPAQLNSSKKPASTGKQHLRLFSKHSLEKAVEFDGSSNDNTIPDELELNIQVEGMTLTEALADAQRSLNPSPGHGEAIKCEDFVYVDDSHEEGVSPEVSQSNFSRVEFEGMTGSSYKEIASCIGDSPEMIYREFENEATQSSSLQISEESTKQRFLKHPLGASSSDYGISIAPSDPGTVSDKWEVGFRQFIACVLSEPALSEFFEQRYDLRDILDKAKSEGLQTCQKSLDESLLDQTN